MEGARAAAVVVGAGRTDLQRHRLWQRGGLGRQHQALQRLQQACVAAITATAGQQLRLAYLARAVDAEAQRCGIAVGRNLRVVTERRTQPLLQPAVATPTFGLGKPAPTPGSAVGFAPAQHHTLLADHLCLDPGVLQQRLQRRKRRQAPAQRMAAAARGKVARVHHRPPTDDTEALDRLFQRLRRDVVGMNRVLCGSGKDSSSHAAMATFKF